MEGILCRVGLSQECLGRLDFSKKMIEHRGALFAWFVVCYYGFHYPDFVPGFTLP